MGGWTRVENSTKVPNDEFDKGCPGGQIPWFQIKEIENKYG
ncbi:hypothetical protein [Clostridium sp.]|nr:hypothetical protein [Clostridium sp.]